MQIDLLANNMLAIIQNTILAWFDDAPQKYKALDDPEWIQYVCNKTGLSENTYKKIILKTRINDNNDNTMNFITIKDLKDILDNERQEIADLKSDDEDENDITLNVRKQHYYAELRSIRCKILNSDKIKKPTIMSNLDGTRKSKV